MVAWAAGLIWRNRCWRDPLADSREGVAANGVARVIIPDWPGARAFTRAGASHHQAAEPLKRVPVESRLHGRFSVPGLAATLLAVSFMAPIVC